MKTYSAEREVVQVVAVVAEEGDVRGEFVKDGIVAVVAVEICMASVVVVLAVAVVIAMYCGAPTLHLRIP